MRQARQRGIPSASRKRRLRWHQAQWSASGAYGRPWAYQDPGEGALGRPPGRGRAPRGSKVQPGPAPDQAGPAPGGRRPETRGWETAR